jgi:DNA-binding NtrC family response regulator
MLARVSRKMSATTNTSSAKILIVEDDLDMADTCAKIFFRSGYQPITCESGHDALKTLAQDKTIHLVLTDLRMPGMDGVELLRQIKANFIDIDVVIMTGHGTISNAVEAIKFGAADYITKPFNKEELLNTIEKITKLHSLEKEVQRLNEELKGKYSFDNIIGCSRPMQQVFERIVAASKIDSTVLITGESGTGKELVARAIHYHGTRAKHPFIPVNCGALPRELIESELFGHKKGSFTGATSDAEGLFKASTGGTIFLDEIAEMSKDTQVKLLRALQEKKIRPVGGTEEFSIDIRLIAATNQNPEVALKDGSLRDDLYYRLSVITIHLPPLRERQEDIPILVQHFINKFNQSFERSIAGIDSDAMEAFTYYGWPGNVRELENVIEGIFALTQSKTIRLADLPSHIKKERKSFIRPVGEGAVMTMQEAERRAIESALKSAEGNKSRAAQILGISRTQLYKKLEEYSALDKT